MEFDKADFASKYSDPVIQNASEDQSSAKPAMKNPKKRLRSGQLFRLPIKMNTIPMPKKAKPIEGNHH